MMVEVDKRTLDMMQAFTKESEKAKQLFGELRSETMRFNEQAGNAHVEATRIADAFSKMSKISAFDEAQESFQSLKENMEEVKNVDLSSLGEAVDGLKKGMSEAFDPKKAVETLKPQTPMVREPAVKQDIFQKEKKDKPASTTHNVNIQTLRVDVSGVTDRTDKKKLANEISEMVTKSLKRKMGGPASNTGYDRGA